MQDGVAHRHELAPACLKARENGADAPRRGSEVRVQAARAVVARSEPGRIVPASTAEGPHGPTRQPSRTWIQRTGNGGDPERDSQSQP